MQHSKSSRVPGLAARIAGPFSRTGPLLTLVGLGLLALAFVGGSILWQVRVLGGIGFGLAIVCAIIWGIRMQIDAQNYELDAGLARNRYQLLEKDYLRVIKENAALRDGTEMSAVVMENAALQEIVGEDAVRLLRENRALRDRLADATDQNASLRREYAKLERLVEFGKDEATSRTASE